jgi:hypothetical protein
LFRKFVTIEHVTRIIDFCIRKYVFGYKLSRFRLCDRDFGITPVDDITIGITCAAFCFHIAHISCVSPWYLFCLSIIVFGEIMCIRDGYVYQEGVLCFFIHESFVRSVRGYCFVCNYAAVPVQLEIVVIQYIGWCVLIVLVYYYYYYSTRILLLLLLFSDFKFTSH